jgi:hypothetical protein
MQETEALSHLKTFYDRRTFALLIVVVIPASFMKKNPKRENETKKVVLCIEMFSYVAVVWNTGGKLIKFYETPERQTKQKSNEKTGFVSTNTSKRFTASQIQSFISSLMFKGLNVAKSIHEQYKINGNESKNSFRALKHSNFTAYSKLNALLVLLHDKSNFKCF